MSKTTTKPIQIMNVHTLRSMIHFMVMIFPRAYETSLDAVFPTPAAIFVNDDNDKRCIFSIRDAEAVAVRKMSHFHIQG